VTKMDISLTPEELTEYIPGKRTIRVATVSPSGAPHVVPLWFVWIDGVIFMNTTLGNATIRNLESNPPAAGVVDDGEAYDDLRGAIVHGRVERADGDPRLGEAARAWSEKYLGGNPVPFDRWRNRVWLRLVPERFTSWDFRKIPEARARARARAAGG
jgi:nitroimidazol reductase NimA-like FMN-containing flavoprotein (pyridoxamine 5'-phosphate oxidase superfamily)